MKLKITKEKVIKAAESCPDAKKVLEEMFPEAFDRSVEVSAVWYNNLIGVRTGGLYRSRAFYLDDFRHSWELKRDVDGMLLLIPTRK